MGKRKRYKKKKKEEHPRVNSDLKGFDIKINTFGEIQSSLKIDELNEFLNKNLSDKKLKNKPLKKDEDNSDKTDEK